MKRSSALIVGIASTVVVLGNLAAILPSTAENRELLAFPDASGVVRTFNSGASIDRANPFFQSLGTNGRACVTCHEPETAWSITPERVRARFAATEGRDPLFRSNDG